MMCPINIHIFIASRVFFSPPRHQKETDTKMIAMRRVANGEDEGVV